MVPTKFLGVNRMSIRAFINFNFVDDEAAAQVFYLALKTMIWEVTCYALDNKALIVRSSKASSYSIAPKVPLLVKSNVVIWGQATTLEYSFPGASAMKSRAPTSLYSNVFVIYL